MKKKGRKYPTTKSRLGGRIANLGRVIVTRKLPKADRGVPPEVAHSRADFLWPANPLHNNALSFGLAAQVGAQEF
jgi:hypothetical protein